MKLELISIMMNSMYGTFNRYTTRTPPDKLHVWHKTLSINNTYQIKGYFRKLIWVAVALRTFLLDVFWCIFYAALLYFCENNKSDFHWF